MLKYDFRCVVDRLLRVQRKIRFYPSECRKKSVVKDPVIFRNRRSSFWQAHIQIRPRNIISYERARVILPRGSEWKTRVLRLSPLRRWIWFQRNCDCGKKRPVRTGTSAVNVNTLSPLRRAPIGNPYVPFTASLEKRWNNLHPRDMTAEKKLFLRTPEDILPLNAYFKLNRKKIRADARRHIPPRMFVLMEYENRDCISAALHKNLPLHIVT